MALAKLKQIGELMLKRREFALCLCFRSLPMFDLLNCAMKGAIAFWTIGVGQVAPQFSIYVFDGLPCAFAANECAHFGLDCGVQHGRCGSAGSRNPKRRALPNPKDAKRAVIKRSAATRAEAQ